MRKQPEQIMQQQDSVFVPRKYFTSNATPTHKHRYTWQRLITINRSEFYTAASSSKDRSRAFSARSSRINFTFGSCVKTTSSAYQKMKINTALMESTGSTTADKNSA